MTITIPDPKTLKEVTPLRKNKSCGDQANVNESLLFILFVAIYAIILAICTSFPKPDSSTFVSWNDVGAGNIIQLAAAITLCFFAPGFAIVLIITKKTMMKSFAKGTTWIFI